MSECNILLALMVRWQAGGQAGWLAGWQAGRLAGKLL
jgi:hypothetical protein